MRIVAFCGVVAISVLLAGCGGGGSSTTTADASGSAAPAPPSAAPTASASPSEESATAAPSTTEPQASQPGSPAGYPPTGSPDAGSASAAYAAQAAAGYGQAPGSYPQPASGFRLPGFGSSAPGYDQRAGAYGQPGAGYEGAPDGSTEGSPYGGLAGMSIRPKSLREQAIDALRAGQHAEGTELLLTHLAIDPAAGDELGEKMGWIPGLRRPAIGPRIGVAALYLSPPRDFDSSPMPIGSPELEAAIKSFQQGSSDATGGEGSKRRRVFGQRGEEGAAAPMGPGVALGGGLTAGYPGGEYGQQSSRGEASQAELAFHTGEVGTKLVAALKERIEAGEYGPLYKDLAEEIARPADPADPNNPQAAPAGYAPPGAGYAPESGRPGISGFSGRPPDGIAGAEGAAGAQAAETKEGPTSLGLAVVWLGKATAKEELAKLAQEANVDLLITYEITLRVVQRTGFVNNSTKIRITNPRREKEEPIFISAGLVNQAVMLDRQKEKKDDPVEKEVGRAIEALDKVCKPAPFPALNTDVVKRRVAALVAEKPADPLPAVVEARYYVVKGLLSEEEMNSAAVDLLGQARHAQMIANVPGAGVGQMIGSALSLPGVLNMLHGLNTAADASANGRARGADQRAEPGGPSAGAPRSGLPSLLPFGGDVGGQRRREDR
jgi:hypothetical protein